MAHHPDAFSQLVTLTVEWAREKAPDLVGNSVDYERLDAEFGGVVVKWAGSPTGYPKLWAFRLSHPDAPSSTFPSADYDPNRLWEVLVNVSLDAEEEWATFHLQMNCLLGEVASLPAQFTRPVLVQRVGATFGCVDAAQPSFLDSGAVSVAEADVPALASYILNPNRTIPVLALADRLHPGIFADLDRLQLGGDLARSLESQLVGLCHIVHLSPEAGNFLLGMWGKEMGVFDGGIRVYYPSPDLLLLTRPSYHPLLVRRAIHAFPETIGPDGTRRLGVVAATYFVRDSLIKHYATQPIHPMPTRVEDVLDQRRAYRKAQQQEAGKEWNELVEGELRELEDKILRLTQDNELYESEIKELKAQVAQLKADLADRNAYIQTLLVQISNQATLPKITPESYSQMAKEANNYFAGKLFLVAKAQKGLANSRYENPGLVWKCLEMLATQYRNQCLGVLGANDEFKQRCQELHVEESRSISDTSAGKAGHDEYSANYEGERVTLDRHLKKGVAHQEDHCLRIYFNWHPQTQTVVVGWLTSHLETPMK